MATVTHFGAKKLKNQLKQSIVQRVIFAT